MEQGLNPERQAYFRDWLNKAIPQLEDRDDFSGSINKHDGEEQDISVVLIEELLYQLVDKLGSRKVFGHNMIRSGITQRTVFEVMDRVKTGK